MHISQRSRAAQIKFPNFIKTKIKRIEISWRRHCPADSHAAPWAAADKHSVLFWPNQPRITRRAICKTVASNVEKKFVFDLNDIIWRTSTVILQKTGKAENRIRVGKKRLKYGSLQI